MSTLKKMIFATREAAGTSGMDIFTALTDEEDRLTALEKRLARVVLDDADFALNASIVELAERAEVSPPTVTRFCRRLGFQGYPDFKLQLARSAYVGLRYLRPETAETATAGLGRRGHRRQGAERALPDAPGPRPRRGRGRPPPCCAAPAMIHAFGSGGNSSMIAHELANRLFRLGCRISASSDHGMNLMLSAACVPGDVVFGSSFTGRNAELVRCFRVLAGARHPDASPSPRAARRSPRPPTLVIAVDLPEGVNIFRPTSTRFAYLAVIDILANLVAYADRPRSARLLRGIKEQLVRHRDEDDRQILGD